MNPSAYFEMLEEVAKEKSDCPRAACSALLVTREGNFSLGWNGAAIGEPSCKKYGCMVENNHCVRSVHAEVRAITAAAREGLRTSGAAVYSLERPCQGCMSVMAEAGVVRVVYKNNYHKKHDADYWSLDLSNYLRLEHYGKA